MLLSSLLFALITATSLVVLFGTVSVFEDAMETVGRDTRSAGLVDELHVSALTYQRLSNRLLITNDPRIADARAAVAAQLAHLAQQVGACVGSAEERLLTDQIIHVVEAYVDERARLDAVSPDVEQIMRQTGPAFGDLLKRLEDLQKLNDQQVERAYLAAQRAQHLSQRFSISAGVLLVVGLFILQVGARRLIYLPIVALHRAVAAYRTGDTEARGALRGARELRELARMYNEMAEALAQQRKAQMSFLAGIAHDLRNPLSTLKNGLYVLALHPSKDQRDRTRATLDSQIDLLSRMVDDLLDAKRIEAALRRV